MPELPNIQKGSGALPDALFFWKNEGETPLEALSRLRLEQPEFSDAVLTYAGRLDPMAEGVLLVLVNEENKNREQYLNLDKEYEVEVLFGISTDTGDVLGKVSNVSQSKIQKLLQTFVGKFIQPYPHYSSKTVGGKPLFQWAREERLGEIEIPSKEVEIYSIEKLGESTMTGEEMLKQVEKRIAKVNGDFRQEEILDSWRVGLENKKEEKFQSIKIRVFCSSGTYMRTLAENIGKSVGVPALAWSIKRTSIKIDI